jgi:hypothetical protein
MVSILYNWSSLYPTLAHPGVSEVWSPEKGIVSLEAFFD